MAPVLSREQQQRCLACVCKALRSPAPVNDPDFDTQYRKLAIHVESIQDEFTYDDIYSTIKQFTCQRGKAKDSDFPLRWDDANKRIQENELRWQPVTSKNQKADGLAKENSKAAAAVAKITANTKSQPTGGENSKEKMKNKDQSSRTRQAKNEGQADTEFNQYVPEPQQAQAYWPQLMMPVVQVGYNCFQPAAQPVTFQVSMTPSFPSMPTGLQGMQCQQPEQVLEATATPSFPSVATFAQVPVEENPWAWLLEEDEMPSLRPAEDLEEQISREQVRTMERCGVVLRNGFWEKGAAKPVLARVKSA